MGLNGAILGDIAGSLYEFDQEKPIDDDLFFGNHTRHSSPTDDTVLSLAVAKAIISQDFNFEKYLREYALEYPSMGYGGNFGVWFIDPNKKAYNSFGNGSAMRVSFCGQIARGSLDAELLAYLSAIPTHNHPEGIKGAIVTAVCIYMAKTGRSKNEILDYAKSKYPLKQYKNSPAHPLSSYRKEDYDGFISCQKAVPYAIRLFYEFDDFNEMMHYINARNIDCDTIGAIAGSIFESFYGKCTDEDEKIIKQKFSSSSLSKKYDEIISGIDKFDYSVLDKLYKEKYHLVEEFWQGFQTSLEKYDNEEIKVGWTCSEYVMDISVLSHNTLWDKIKRILKPQRFRL